MKDIYEITIIGRGGQGAKTASEVLAGAALDLGKYIQAFSEYGAERSGAPVLSYIRISDKPITIHSGITNPDLIVVMDSTLIDMACPTKDGKLIVNTVQSPQQVRERLNFKTGKVYTVDLTGISVEILGMNIPNTPTLGAIAKVESIVPKDKIEEELRQKLEHKIGKTAMDKNIQCLEKAFNEVKEG